MMRSGVPFLEQAEAGWIKVHVTTWSGDYAAWCNLSIMDVQGGGAVRIPVIEVGMAVQDHIRRIRWQVSQYSHVLTTGVCATA